jgi:hypothetical protein
MTRGVWAPSAPSVGRTFRLLWLDMAGMLVLLLRVDAKLAIETIHAVTVTAAMTEPMEEVVCIPMEEVVGGRGRWRKAYSPANG